MIVGKLIIFRIGKLENLLSDTLESYYWIGFLLADGTIHGNRLQLELAILDKKHQEKKFAKLLI